MNKLNLKILINNFDGYNYLSKENNLILIKENNGENSHIYGVYNLKLDRIILPCEYDNIYICDNKKYINVSKGSYQGIADLNGNTIIPIKYKSLKYYGGNLIIAEDINGYFFLDLKGDRINDKIYTDIRFYLFNCNIIYYIVEDFNNNTVGICNKTGKEIFLNNNSDIKINSKDGFDGLIIKVNNKYGVISYTGEEIIPLEYNFISLKGPYNFTIVRNSHFRYGIINIKTGDIIMPCEHKSIEIFNNKMILIKDYYKRESIYLINNTLELKKFPDKCVFCKLYIINKEFIFIMTDHIGFEYCLYNQKGIKISDYYYDIYNISHTDLFIVQNHNHKYGLINSKGKVLLYPVYSIIDYISKIHDNNYVYALNEETELNRIINVDTDKVIFETDDKLNIDAGYNMIRFTLYNSYGNSNSVYYILPKENDKLIKFNESISDMLYYIDEKSAIIYIGTKTFVGTFIEFKNYIYDLDLDDVYFKDKKNHYLVLINQLEQLILNKIKEKII